MIPIVGQMGVGTAILMGLIRLNPTGQLFTSDEQTIQRVEFFIMVVTEATL
jgi:hypothetical protein